MPGVITKVLFLIYDLEPGGPEMRLLDFAKHFPDDIAMSICVTSTNVSMQSDFEAAGVRVDVMPVRKPYWEWASVRKIHRYIEANDFDVINVFDLKGLVIAAALKCAKWRWRIVYHTVNAVKTHSWKQLFAFKWFLRMTAAVIANSWYSKSQFSRIMDEKRIHVIHNGIDTVKFVRDPGRAQLLRERYEIREGEIVIGMVANFRNQKNYPLLLRIFAELHQRHNRLRLLCVGGGEGLAECKVMAGKLGIQSATIFTGRTRDVVGFLGIIDIFVLTSLWEGLPTVVIEAMSMGIPVVAGRLCGCPEIIGNMVDGLLVDPGVQERYVEAVNLLLEDSVLARNISKNAVAKVKASFTLELMVARYAGFFRKIAGTDRIGAA